MAANSEVVRGFFCCFFSAFGLDVEHIFPLCCELVQTSIVACFDFVYYVNIRLWFVKKLARYLTALYGVMGGCLAWSWHIKVLIVS